MALLFLNKTICPICGKVLKDTDQVFSFPSFIQNKKDPYSIFNDSSFHIDCLTKHKLGKSAISYAEQFIFDTRPSNRICIISKEVIKNYQDYIFFDLLSTDKNSDLYQFNFMTINRNNLNEWEKRILFLKAANKIIDDNKWEDFGSFQYLKNLIKIVSGN